MSEASEIEMLIHRTERLQERVAELENSLRSAEQRLEDRINDERVDRERADDSLRSDLDSVRHDVQYGR
jgi:hypothetical protein